MFEIKFLMIAFAIFCIILCIPFANRDRGAIVTLLAGLALLSLIVIKIMGV